MCPRARLLLGDRDAATEDPPTSGFPRPVRSTPASAAAPAEPAPLATPPVRKLAKDLGIDLAAVTATRQDGVISRADVENAVAAKGSAPKSGRGQAYDPATREHRIPVKGIR